MNRTDTLKLFDYSFWATALIMNRVEELTDEQYMAEIPGISHGSIHATLAHMLAAGSIWRQRCFDGVSPTKMLSAQDFSGQESVRAFGEMEELKMRAALGSLTDESLMQLVHYRTTNGQAFANPRGEILYHLTIHGVQHRSEAAAALTYFDRSPGDVDMIMFLRL